MQTIVPFGQKLGHHFAGRIFQSKPRPEKGLSHQFEIQHAGTAAGEGKTIIMPLFPFGKERADSFAEIEFRGLFPHEPRLYVSINGNRLQIVQPAETLF